MEQTESKGVDSHTCTSGPRELKGPAQNRLRMLDVTYWCQNHRAAWIFYEG